MLFKNILCSFLAALPFLLENHYLAEKNMPEITNEIQKLIEQGQTEQALEALANWLRTQHTTALNEVILLRSRYEQAEKELSLNLISPEEAARTYSQINYALLNLLQNLDKPAPFTPSPTNRRGWLIAGAGAVLLLVLIMFVLKILYPSREISNSNQDHDMTFPQGNKVSLTVNESTATYTLLEGKAESYNPENQKITLKIRCYLQGKYDMNFWESDFRLIAKELPYAAQGGLNEVVSGDSFKDGEVYFLIPRDLRSADLRINFYDQYTLVPMKW